MRCTFFLAFGLAACSKGGIYHPRYVSTEARASFELIASGVNDLLGFDAVSVDTEHGQGQVYFSANKIAKVTTAADGEVLGYELNSDVILNPLLTTAHRPVVMAHELGHAMGLEHTSHGLMTVTLALDCIGIEAECLINALAEQGILPSKQVQP